MAPTMPTRTHAAESRERHRSDTAKLLHAATVGLCKQIAAELAVSQSRINKQISGCCANTLELLDRWLDRLEREGAPAEDIDNIVRHLAKRRRCDLAHWDAAAAPSPAAELGCIAADMKAAGEAIAAASHAAADGIDAAEAELLLPLIENHVERAQELRAHVETRKAKAPAITKPALAVVTR